MMMHGYRQDLEQAWARVCAVPTQTLQTPHGAVEYAVSGGGPPVLLSHGILGSHVEGVGMVDTYVGGEMQAIAPARFGYFGSELPADASPALQADLYAGLLDYLAITRAVVVGYSAGGPSAIQFGLRHPDRTTALVLVSSALPPSSRPPAAARPLMSAATVSELAFWSFARLMPGTLRGLMGVPAGYVPGPEEAATIESVAASIFPVHPRRRGFVFDAFVGNPSVREARLEDLAVPTLIVHAADDSLAPYANAKAAAPRIPGVQFVSVESGGHLFLGQEARVRDAISSFLSIVPSSVGPK